MLPKLDERSAAERSSETSQITASVVAVMYPVRVKLEQLIGMRSAVFRTMSTRLL
jgi:hypothetical protein